MSELNDQLNGLLIDIGRSFLQYVGECWPWTVQSAERKAIAELVLRQSEDIARLANALDAAGHAIDFGTYPTEYTDKHFVTLDFLVNLLEENQRDVVAEAEAVKLSFSRNGDQSGLLNSTLETETGILQSLEGIAKQRAVGGRG